MSDPVLRLYDICRTYKTGAGDLEVLKSVTFEVQAGEITALVAPSGTGKSTLLHVAGVLERPNGGEVAISGNACSVLTDRERTYIRRHDIGFVYQFHHLQGEFNALENIMLPQMIAGISRKDAKIKAAQ